MNEDIFAQVYEKKKQLAAHQEMRKGMQKERAAWSKQNEENAKREAPPAMGKQEVKKRLGSL